MKYNAHRCKIQLLICSNGLMRPEDSLGDAAGFEQREAQEHRVAMQVQMADATSPSVAMERTSTA